MRVRRPVLSASVAAVLAAGALAGLGVAPAGAEPAPYVEQSFAGVTADGWRALGDACLTRATQPGAVGVLGACDREPHGDGPADSGPAATTEPGTLQLTAERSNRTGGVVWDRPVSSAAGLVATFDQYQYGWEQGGGDGIAFFLTDGRAEITSTGASGGALGYGPKQYSGPQDGTGLPDAYLGVGLDAFGGFARQIYSDEVVPCTALGRGQWLDSVTLRGPGDGNTGYCPLATAQTPTDTRLREEVGPRLTDQQRLAVARRSVRVTVSPGPFPRVSVEMDFPRDEAGYVLVLDHQLDSEDPALAAPPTYRFGFVGATGGVRDVNLVSDVTVRPISTAVGLGLTKAVTGSVPAGGYVVGEEIPYTLTATNTGTEALTDLAVVGGDLTGVTCDVTALPTTGDVATCTGSHVVTEADLAGGATTYAAPSSVTAKAGGQDVTGGPATAAPVAIRAADVEEPDPEPDPPVVPGPTRTSTTTSLRVTATGVTATVTSADGSTPTGRVTLSGAGRDLGVATLTPTGTPGVASAVLPATVPSGSDVRFTASYSGDGSRSGSTGHYDRTDPELSAAVESEGVPNAAGWYRDPVRVVFTCTAGSAPLTARCPRPQSRRNTAADLVLERSVTATDGGAASVEVPLRVDSRGPVLSTSRARGPHGPDAEPVRCTASDGRSGLAGSCRVTYGRLVVGSDGERRRTWSAVARDVAGNTTRRSGSFAVSH